MTSRRAPNSFTSLGLARLSTAMPTSIGCWRSTRRMGSSSSGPRTTCGVSVRDQRDTTMRRGFRNCEPITIDELDADVAQYKISMLPEYRVLNNWLRCEVEPQVL